MACVYKHTFPNGAVYIGKTSMKPEDRWLNGWGYRGCPLMFSAILQYGWENIKHEILVDNISDEDAFEIERKEIEAHTMSIKGVSCTVPPAQSRLHNDSSTERSPQSPTMIYNVSELPPQYLAQENTHFITTTDTPYVPQRGVHNAPHGNSGIPQKKEYIIPIVEKPIGINRCPIDVYTKDGVFICTYPSGKIAAKEMGVNHGDVISCCKGVKSDGSRKYQVNGYIFRYHI